MMHGIDDGEEHRAHADPQRQRRQRDDRKSGRAADGTQRMRRVAAGVFEQRGEGHGNLPGVTVGRGEARVGRASA
jgi:hypothetical protein